MAQLFGSFSWLLGLSTLAFGWELRMDPAELPSKKPGDVFMVTCYIRMDDDDWLGELSIRWVRRQDGVDSDIPFTGRVSERGRSRMGVALLNRNVQNEDAGEYVCMASVKQERMEASITLNVLKFQPPPVPLVLFFKERHPNFANISIKELPEAVRPQQISFFIAKQEDVTSFPDFFFHLDVLPVTFDFKPDNYYVIQNLTTKTVYQVWAFAKNEMGRSLLTPEPFIYETTQFKKPPRLFNWSDIPVWSYGGHRVELSCEVRAFPSPTWTWYHNSKSLVPDGDKIIIEESEDGLLSTLKIVTNTQEDFGKYICMADNGVGTEVAVEMPIIQIQVTPTPETLVVKDNNMKCFRFCFP